MADKDINIEVVSIDDLIQDDHNFNRGTEEGQHLIERSFQEYGAGRSVFIDKNNRLVAGNKAQQGFKAAGKQKVVIVDTDGDTLVAVRRKDVDLDTAEGRTMAMLDNRTSQVNLQWDEAQLEAVSAATDGFQPEEYMPEGWLEQLKAEAETAEFADERDNKDDKKERQRDPDSEIIVATVSLFGTTEDMMLTQALTTEEADKLIRLTKQEGAGNLMKRIIEAL